MAAAWIVINGGQEGNDREQSSQFHRFYRNLRDSSNPFEIPNNHFLKLFRLNKEAAQFIVNEVTPHLPDEIKVTAIPNYLKIFCALHFLGQGSYQANVGVSAFLAMSQPSVSRCIIPVCRIIVRRLLNRWIKFPVDRQIIEDSQNKFLNQYGFPGVLGAIDCSHVSIIAPPAEHPVYPAAPFYNRKRYYSINVQIITDASLKIINMNAKYPGSVHDSAIWMMSNVNALLRREYLNDALYYHLIGDEGYPLSPWLLVPHPGHFEDNTPHGRFNTHLRSARMTIERVNGILKSRFRCLLKHRTLNYSPPRASIIIYTCAVLHNVALHFNVEMPDDEDDNDENQENNVNEINDYNNEQNNFFEPGSRKRNRITNQFFNRNI